MTYRINLPSGGLFSSVPYVWVNSITLGEYIDMLSIRNSGRLAHMILDKCVVDKTIVSNMPFVDRDYILTNIYMEDFSESATFNMKCPYCSTKSKEEFIFGEYETKFLDENDRWRFAYRLFDRTIKFVLPTAPASVEERNSSVLNFRRYLHPDHNDEVFTESEQDELTLHVISDIMLEVGLLKESSYVCNNCGFNAPTTKPTGFDMLNEKKSDMIDNEKMFIFDMLNSFANGAHQPMAGVTSLTLKNATKMFESLLQIKDGEAKALR